MQILVYCFTNKRERDFNFTLSLKVLLPYRTLEGQTALQLAISNQLPLVVDAICTRGADMSVVDEKGDPPLWLALENGLEDIASTLVSGGRKSVVFSGCREIFLFVILCAFIIVLFMLEFYYDFAKPPEDLCLNLYFVTSSGE